MRYLEDRTLYERIVDVLKRYVDMDERYYTVVALWIAGTYFHDQFRTYPYLFMNASKGSGKTRLLKLIAYLSKNGKVVGLPSEAYVFRSAAKTTFCFDEMENLDKKESQELRLLLNSAYKRGLFIPRMKKGKEGEMEVEEFEAFAPICIANIWGLDDVLTDRCIPLVLERSGNKAVTRKIEAWDGDEDAAQIKEDLQKLTTATDDDCVVCVVKPPILRCIEKMWNDLMEASITIPLLTTLSTHTQLTNITTQTESDTTLLFRQLFMSLNWDSYKVDYSSQLEKFFEKIYRSDIDGRNLELYFPLFMAAGLLSEDVLEQMIAIALAETAKKSSEDAFENRDSGLLMSLAALETDEFMKVEAIRARYAEAVGEDRERRDGSVMKIAPKWLNAKWVGRAMKRMNIIGEKRRTAEGIEVRIDFNRVKAKLRVLGIALPDIRTGDAVQTRLPEVDEFERQAVPHG